MMGMDMYAGFVSVKTATKKRAKAVGYFPAMGREDRAQRNKTCAQIAAIITHGHARHETLDH
jgi:hypothetical protein